MALIKCPECGQSVSDQASTCPHCGYSIQNYLKQQNEEQMAKEKEAKRFATINGQTYNIEQLYEENHKNRVQTAIKLSLMADIEIKEATEILNNSIGSETIEHSDVPENTDSGYSVCPQCGFHNPMGVFTCQNCSYKYKLSDYNVHNVPKIIPEKIHCPKCGSSNISFQREQSGNIGIGTNRVVVVDNPRSKGCLYWGLIGWWWEPFSFFGWKWWTRLFFGHRKKGGLNIYGSKTINSTIAVCQDCGYTWKNKK